jgi:antitoxin PrlF
MRSIMESAIGIKGQVTIPKAIRDHLHLKPGDKVRFFVHPDGSVVLLPKLPITALRGMIKCRQQTVTIEEMNEAIGENSGTGMKQVRKR